MKRRSHPLILGLAFLSVSSPAAITLSPDGYHVHPGDNIQDAIQQAAANPTNKNVKVHAGEYRPHTKRQALIWFNKRHEGVRLEAVGAVTLTAANPDLSKTNEPSYPAVVNHVVYFGDGISSNTLIRGFKITGANNFVMRSGTALLEPDLTVPKNSFFFSDGGAIKVFGRSSPTIQNIEVIDNFSNPCGGGISVQQQGFNQNPVTIENCIFRNNRCQSTGSAVDLLEGSSARIINCLFVGNISNMGEDPVAKKSGEKPFENCGAVTVFWRSWMEMRNCTFTGNRNGIDDMSGASTYANCLFYDNTLEAGLPGHPRYDLAIPAGAKSIEGCFFNGQVTDPKKIIGTKSNTFNAPSPNFDANLIPQSAEFKNAGYRLNVVR